MNTVTAQRNPSDGGNLKSLENAKDGWIMTQIKKDKPLPIINVSKGIDDTVRISSKINRIASAIAGYNLKRSYHRQKDGSIAFFYSVKGSFEHSTVKQLELIKELLTAKFTDDYQSLFFDSNPTLQRALEAKISLQHSTVYLYFEIKFEKEWIPGEEFWEV